NIITKNARSTGGGQVTVATGNEWKASETARWGSAAKDRVAWRIWEKFDYRTPAFDSTGYYNYATLVTYQARSIRNLDSAGARVRFRADGEPNPKDQWMIQGDLFKSDRQDPLAMPVLYPNIISEQPGHSDYFGGYLQARWTHTDSPGSERTLQVSFDRSR